LQCALAIQVADWPAAWKAMEGYLSRTNRANLPCAKKTLLRVLRG